MKVAGFSNIPNYKKPDILRERNVKDQSAAFLLPDHISFSKQSLNSTENKKIKSEHIAGRIVEGKNVNDKDLKYLQDTDPILAMEARFAKNEKEKLAQKVNLEKSKTKRKEMIREARLSAAAFSKFSEVRTNLLLHGIRQVEKEET